MMKTKLFAIMLFLPILMACIKINKEQPVEGHLYRRVEGGIKQLLPSDFVPRHFQICALGDSLTLGYGSSMNPGGYPIYLREKLVKAKGIKDVTIEPYGVSGNRSSHLLNRLNDEKLIERIRRADIIIITIGGNDIMKVVKDQFFDLELEDFRREGEDYQARLEEIIRKMKDINPKALIFLVGLYNPFIHLFGQIDEFDFILDEWNNLAKSVLKEYNGTYFIPIDEGFASGGVEFLYEDYFHPNDRGYQYIADQIYLSIIEHLFP